MEGEKHFSWQTCTKFGGETSSTPFSEKSKLNISLDQ